MQPRSIIAPMCAAATLLVSSASLASGGPAQQMADFLANNPKFANQQSFSVVLRKYSTQQTETLLSKNMQLLPLTQALPDGQAQRCTTHQAEICLTENQASRTVKQACECVDP